jgi:hypothetical protein
MFRTDCLVCSYRGTGLICLRFRRYFRLFTTTPYDWSSYVFFTTPLDQSDSELVDFLSQNIFVLCRLYSMFSETFSWISGFNFIDVIGISHFERLPINLWFGLLPISFGVFCHISKHLQISCFDSLAFLINSFAIFNADSAFTFP